MAGRKKLGGRLFLIFLFLGVIAWVVFLSRAKYKLATLPVLGEKSILASGDTVFHTIDTFTLTSQFGLPFGSDSLKNKIYLTSFFFTSCPDVCPVINSNINLVRFKFLEVPDVLFISMSVDPETDSVARLKEYARKFGNPQNWRFLTGRKSKIYGLAEYSFLSVAAGSAKEAWAHTELLTLVDHKGRIRGVFEGRGDQRVLDEIVDAIKLLRYEKAHESK